MLLFGVLAAPSPFVSETVFVSELVPVFVSVFIPVFVSVFAAHL